MSDKSSRVVYVGNIPYDIPEELITETLSRVGQVLTFRLVIDKETNKQKGYGFAEFADADAASSAIRNLNDFELMGRRLRVDYPNDGMGAESTAPFGPGSGATGIKGSTIPSTTSSTALPPFPSGVIVPSDTTSIDMISQTLKQIKLPQLLDIIKEVKTLVHKDPLKATELFRQAPQLSYAVFQCLLLMGLVDARDLSSILANQPVPGGASNPASQGPTAGSSAGGSGMPAPVATAAPTAPPPPPTAAAPVTSQQQLIEQVLALTPQQIAMLPEPDRRQIEELKRQISTGGFR